MRLLNSILALCVGLLVGLTFYTISSCKSTDNYRSDPADHPYTVNRWGFSEMNRMHTMPWLEAYKKASANNKIRDEGIFDDYNPASFVFFDRHENGLCLGFWGNSFIQAPSWACKKK